ncbi:Chloroperoxidase [Boletus edulis BED1]|uniref:Chloroperoxidase n=1 Tax=Boletus edulis BED1 TaxID=1328754 RepID=A0AAD4GDZ2_BOLED|nr:Chloroperoxidase [Boletus edulis BED1]
MRRAATRPGVDTAASTTSAITETPFSPLLASPVPAHDHHSHASGICLVRGADNAFCPPQPGDKRSPCPALNALSNHGFLPRDGRNIGPFKIYHALREGYNLSMILAFILAFGGWAILGQLRKVSLLDLSRHNCIEHDASLFHLDAHGKEEYAPIAASNSLMKSALYQGGRYRSGHMTLEDVANIRVKREAALEKPLRWWQAEIARGEMAVAIGVLGGKDADKKGLDLEVLRLWVTQERLPDDWEPDHTQGLFKTGKMATVIRDRMAAMKKGQMTNILDNELTPIFSPTESVSVGI